MSPYLYITEYRLDKIKFTYILHFTFNDLYKLLYKAILDNIPKTLIIVKFTHKYNIEVHCLLAAKGLASRLYYSSIDNCGSRCLA